MDQKIEKTSKFLSFILRHKPESIGITLDSDGWVELGKLIKQANKHGKRINLALIHQIVQNNDKKRFTLSTDGLKIRAAQGHSTTQVNLQYKQQVPPAILYHGTATRFIDSIKQQGLIAGSRHYVHLSVDESTAQLVGKRHGKPIVLKVNALSMHQQGSKFFLADNGVWLVESVSVEFIQFA